MTAFPKPCGRLDWHDEHEWTAPRDPFWSQAARTYRCVGRVLLEGGMYADWDATDERADRERRGIA